MRNWKVFVLAIGVAHTSVWAQADGGKGNATGDATAARLAESFEGEKSFARPSRDSTMGFTFPVEIREVLVKGGDVVKKGDIMVAANAEEARYQRDLQKLLAETELDVRRAEAALKQAQVEFDAQKAIKEQIGGAPVEFQRAEAQLEIRTVERDIAKFQQTQLKVQLSIREAYYERFILRAPFDGIVDQVGVDPGEVKRDAEPVIRVVDIDPLWIDVAAPLALTITLDLKPGDKAWALMDLPGEPQVRAGKVIEVSPAADERSGTRRVRVELANAGWPAGLTCWVRFTEPTGDWSARIVADSGAALPSRLSGLEGNPEVTGEKK